MKKFLSLVLALVMTMSLVTISAGAKDFTDDSKITYEEAVNVISEIGVVNGYADGSFGPTAPLTRQAAAKIICNLILGPTTASELAADTAPYSDVPTTSEFAGYIAYCQKENIISGYGDGTFKPGNPLTGYAFMKMLLGALGYDPDVEQYVGANWSISVAKRAKDIGLNKGLEGTFNGTKTVTREEACLYAFNTLQADLVEYDTSLGVNAAGNLTGLSIAKAQTWNNSATRINNIKNDNYIQFAEQYFNKLVKQDDQDAFGRPAYTWVYNKREIGTYVDYSILVAEYTEGVEGGEVYDVIGGSAAKDFDVAAYLDGFKVKSYNEEGVAVTKTADKYSEAVAEHIYKKSEEDLEDSGDGVLTQVFVDTDKEEITIVFINTWLAEVTANYNDKTEKLTLKVFNGYETGTGPKGGTVVTGTKSYATSALLDEVANVEDFEKEDVVRITIADGVVKTVDEAEVLEDSVISSYSADPDDDNEHVAKMKSITTGGTKYDAAKQAFEDATYLFNYALNQLKDKTYDVYLDAYGYVLGIRPVDADDQYMFVVGYEQTSTVLAQAIDKALVIFTDGTMETVQIKDNDLAADGVQALALTDTNGKNGAVNKWFTYTEKNGVYTLDALVKTQIHETQADIAARTNGTTTGNGTISGLYATLEGKDNTALATAVANTPKTAAYAEGNGTKQYIVGNDKSVYITVKADEKVVAGGSITKVSNVSTGIKNTNIYVTDALDNVTGAYSIYNSKGYVTYSVVLGRNSGSSANLVYLTSGIAREHYDDPNLGETYWVYDCIRNGELTTIKSLVTYADNNKNNDLEEGVLYEALFDADGYVTDMTTKVELAKINTTTHKAEGYQYQEIKTPADAITALQIQGAALHLITDTDDQYIVLADDCNFFVKSAATDKKYQQVADADTVLAYLGKTIADENADNSTTVNAGVTGYNFTGVLAAICDERGYATTLILMDSYKVNDDKAPDYKPETKSDNYAATLVNTGTQIALTTGVVTGGTGTIGDAYSYVVTATNTTSGAVVYVDGTGVVGTNSLITVPNGNMTYQATVTFANGDVVVTNTVMG